MTVSSRALRCKPLLNRFQAGSVVSILELGPRGRIPSRHHGTRGIFEKHLFPNLPLSSCFSPMTGPATFPNAPARARRPASGSRGSHRARSDAAKDRATDRSGPPGSGPSLQVMVIWSRSRLGIGLQERVLDHAGRQGQRAETSLKSSGTSNGFHKPAGPSDSSDRPTRPEQRPCFFHW